MSLLQCVCMWECVRTLAHTHTYTHTDAFQANIPLKGPIFVVSFLSLRKMYETRNLQILFCKLIGGALGCLQATGECFFIGTATTGIYTLTQDIWFKLLQRRQRGKLAALPLLLTHKVTATLGSFQRGN